MRTLYIPPQGSGRIDNPAVYSVLCVSTHPAGAIAEAFGRLPERSQLCGGNEKSPFVIRNARRLVALKLRPSKVVIRDDTRSRDGALRMDRERKSAGVRSWSYYGSAWASLGIWQTERLILKNVGPLRLDHPALLEASRVIVRSIVPDRTGRPTRRKRARS